MDINTFLQIGIIGTIASLVIEAITKLAGTKPLTSKIVAIAVAIIFGTFYYFASKASWWTSVVAVLAASSLVYAFLFNKNA